jgi:hypothetical protein
LQLQTDALLVRLPLLSPHLLLLLLLPLLLLLVLAQHHASCLQGVTRQLGVVVVAAVVGSNRDNPADHDDVDYARNAYHPAAVAAAALAAAAAGY